MKFLRLPYGVSPAPEIFQRKTLALARLDGVACIRDDILVYGCGDDSVTAQQDHDRNLIALFERCRQQGLKLNKEKMNLNRQSVKFMGHELTASGLRPDARKIEAVRRMPPPVDRNGVLRLLGMAIYLAKFRPSFSEATAPLRELATKDTEFVWDKARHDTALQKLKDLLSAPPVLQYYDVIKPVTVQCDASQGGLGAVIMQDGKPVEYASGALSRVERDSYAQIEKELLAIVFSLESFHTSVFVRRITVQTDHRPLLAIVKKSLRLAPKQLQRMILRLQRYNYDLVWLPGSQMILIDTLSRAYPPVLAETNQFTEQLVTLAEDQMTASTITMNIINDAVATDDQYARLRTQIAVGCPDRSNDLKSDLGEFRTFADELTVCDDLIFKGTRLVVPSGERQAMLERVHSSHIGTIWCIRRAREIIFYSGMVADIKALVQRCEICREYDAANPKETLLSHAIPSKPWEKVGVDIFMFSDKSSRSMPVLAHNGKLFP